MRKNILNFIAVLCLGSCAINDKKNDLPEETDSVQVANSSIPPLIKFIEFEEAFQMSLVEEGRLQFIPFNHKKYIDFGGSLRKYRINKNQLTELIKEIHDSTKGEGFLFAQFQMDTSQKVMPKYNNFNIWFSGKSKDSSSIELSNSFFVKSHTGKESLNYYKKANTYLRDNGVLGFDLNENFEGIIFEIDLSKIWLDSISDDTVWIYPVFSLFNEHYRIKSHPTVLFSNDSNILSLIKTKDTYSYGNRGGVCCP